MKAIILAGGFGTRLRSVIADVPKPMAPIHEKPFLAYLLDYLITQGITEVVLSVHYLREQIVEYFNSEYCGIPIHYSIEDEPLGTGGAIAHALQFIDSSEPVFILNGDTFLKLDYRKMISERQPNQPIMMALRSISDCSRYGVVMTEGAHVTSFNEQGSHHPGLINAGVYLINPGFLNEFSLPKQFSFERDFLFPNINKLRPQAFAVDDYFIDIGIPDDYARAVKEFPTLMK